MDHAKPEGKRKRKSVARNADQQGKRRGKKVRLYAGQQEVKDRTISKKKPVVRLRREGKRASVKKEEKCFAKIKTKW